MDNRACLDLIEAALRPGTGLQTARGVPRPQQRQSEPLPTTHARTLAFTGDDDDDNDAVDSVDTAADDYEREERLRAAGIYTAEDGLAAALESAEQRDWADPRAGAGFAPAEVHRLVELALCAVPAAAALGAAEQYQLQRRLLRVAVPERGVDARTVVLLAGALNSADAKGKQLALEWLLGVLDCVAPAGRRVLQERLYFAVFQCLQYDLLHDAAACLLVRLTRAADVLPCRVRRLVRLFERSGSPRVALLLCLYQRLAPELFVLPFDPARVLGSDDKIAALLARPLLASKAFLAFHDRVVARHAALGIEPTGSSGNQVPSPTSASTATAASAATTTPAAATTSSSSLETGTGTGGTATATAIPPVTYLFSPRARKSEGEGGAPEEEAGTGSVRASEYATVGAFVAALPAAPASVWRCVQCPDHLASVLAAPVLASVAGCCCAPGATATAAPRLGQWALHSLRRACLAAAPHSLAPGRAVVAALARFGRVFRELPPCVEVFLAPLLSKYNPLRRAALPLLAWTAPETFPASRAGCHAVLRTWLQPSLRECYHHRDMALALLALAALVRRAAAGCCARNPAYRAPARLFRHTCVVPGLPGWAARPGDPGAPCLLRHVAAYALRAAADVAAATQCHAEVQDALLALCEALADVAGRCPACPARAPRDLLLALFHTASAVAVSRALGAVVAFDKAGADLCGLEAQLHAELCDRAGAFSLVAHPALAPFVARFVEAVNAELAKSAGAGGDTRETAAAERSMVADDSDEDESVDRGSVDRGSVDRGAHARVTPTNILDDHVESFLTFLAARRLTGLVEFFSRWPMPAAASLSTEMDY